MGDRYSSLAGTARLPPTLISYRYQLGCITTTLSSSPTALINLTATCTNNTLQASLAKCIQGGCNITEQLHFTLADSQLCAGVPIESCTWQIVIVGLVTGPLALLAVALRCYSRYAVTRYFGADDWFIAIAAVLLIPLVTLQILGGLKYGIGRHIWNINLEIFLQGLKAIYVGDILYVTVLALVKSSILLFYLRLFPSEWFRITTLTVLILVIGSAIAVNLALIFQCRPISRAWNPRIHARCVNVNALSHAAGGISIAQDIVILILPIPTCLNLNMDLKKKLNVLVMFSIGGIASLISILRFKYLVDISRSTDPSWDSSVPLVWSFLEINMAIICACLPALRAFLSRIIPCLFEINTPDRPPWSNPSFISGSNLHSHQHPKVYVKTTQHRGIAVSLEELTLSHPKSVHDDVEAAPPGVGFGESGGEQKVGRGGEEKRVWIVSGFNGRGDLKRAQGLGELWSASDSETSLIIPR